MRRPAQQMPPRIAGAVVVLSTQGDRGPRQQTRRVLAPSCAKTRSLSARSCLARSSDPGGRAACAVVAHASGVEAARLRYAGAPAQLGTHTMRSSRTRVAIGRNTQHNSPVAARDVQGTSRGLPVAMLPCGPDQRRRADPPNGPTTRRRSRARMVWPRRSGRPVGAAARAIGAEGTLRIGGFPGGRL